MPGISVEDPAAHAHMHANPTGGSLFHVNLRVCLGSSGHFVATLHTVSNRVDNSPCSERRPCRSPSFGIRDLCLPRHPEFCEAAGQRHFWGMARWEIRCGSFHIALWISVCITACKHVDNGVDRSVDNFSLHVTGMSTP